MKQFTHTCSDGHHEIGFHDPDGEFSERCPLCKEIDRMVDGIRNHLIALGAPADRIDGAGCDSGDPLDFTTAEITQAFSYFEDQRPKTGNLKNYAPTRRRIRASGSNTTTMTLLSGATSTASRSFTDARAIALVNMNVGSGAIATSLQNTFD